MSRTGAGFPVGALTRAANYINHKPPGGQSHRPPSLREKKQRFRGGGASTWNVRGEEVLAPVQVHGEAIPEAEGEEVSPLWAASLNKGEATMNASLTQTYAKAVRDLAEAAQMIRGAVTAEGRGGEGGGGEGDEECRQPDFR